MLISLVRHEAASLYRLAENGHSWQLQLMGPAPTLLKKVAIQPSAESTSLRSLPQNPTELDSQP